MEKQLTINYQLITDLTTLTQEDKSLLAMAESQLQNAYAPYSNFRVAAAILLANGETVCGTNQENAAYPMCVCAEVVALNACASQFSGVALRKIAITVQSPSGEMLEPAAPCGQCRQTILEYETRYNSPIEILLFQAGKKLIRFDSIKSLLPFYFSGKDLQ